MYRRIFSHFHTSEIEIKVKLYGKCGFISQTNAQKLMA